MRATPAVIDGGRPTVSSKILIFIIFEEDCKMKNINECGIVLERLPDDDMEYYNYHEREYDYICYEEF